MQGEGGREHEARGRRKGNKEEGGGAQGRAARGEADLVLETAGVTVEPDLHGQTGRWPEQVTGEGEEEGMKSEWAARKHRSSAKPPFVQTHRHRARGLWVGHPRAIRPLLRSGDSVSEPGSNGTSESPDSPPQ